VVAKGLCRRCYDLARKKAGPEKKKVGRKPRKQSGKASKASRSKQEAFKAVRFDDNRFFVEIDQALWARIKKVAEAELRTPENQAMYMLRSSCMDFEQGLRSRIRG
jgi:hypothetical protein